MSIEAEAVHAEQVRRRPGTPVHLLPSLEDTLATHRPVWGPGVQTTTDALHHVDELILRTLPVGVSRPTLVDLGCRAGASLLYLATRIEELIGEGLTLDAQEAACARQAIAAVGVTDRVRCREVSYLAPPVDLHACADLTYSVESFVHSIDPARFLQQAARTLRPGGTLVICDDFLSPRALQPSSRAARLLRDLRDARRMTALVTVSQLRDLAAPFGLVLARDLDLSGHLERPRRRDRWLARLVAAIRPLLSTERWRPLVASTALQRALTDGLLRYRLLELQLRS